MTASTSAPATLDSWLTRREPPPPRTLAVRVRSALGECVHVPMEEAPERLVAAAERLLAALLAANATDRRSALDLLAADALMTYAFEAAGEDAAQLARRATAAMAQVARLGSATGGGSSVAGADGAAPAMHHG